MKEDETVKVYWQPGCSSCLKTKEFLMDNGIPFKSVNVLEDKTGFEDLQKFGVKMVPIVAKGDAWANGAVFRDVANVAGFDYQAHKSNAVISERFDFFINICLKFFEVFNKHIDTLLPGRPRSYRQLVYHIFNIQDVFLKRVEDNAPYT